MNSILQDEKKCFVTGQEHNLHCHHIFRGSNRKISEKYGFKIWLIPELHNMSDKGIHNDKYFDNCIKMQCQKKFEETHTREEFIKLIGRSYL